MSYGSNNPYGSNPYGQGYGNAPGRGAPQPNYNTQGQPGYGGPQGQNAYANSNAPGYGAPPGPHGAPMGGPGGPPGGPMGGPMGGPGGPPGGQMGGPMGGPGGPPGQMGSAAPKGSPLPGAPPPTIQQKGPMGPGGPMLGGPPGKQNFGVGGENYFRNPQTNFLDTEGLNQHQQLSANALHRLVELAQQQEWNETDLYEAARVLECIDPMDPGFGGQHADAMNKLWTRNINLVPRIELIRFYQNTRQGHYEGIPDDYYDRNPYPRPPHDHMYEQQMQQPGQLGPPPPGGPNQPPGQLGPPGPAPGRGAPGGPGPGPQPNAPGRGGPNQPPGPPGRGAPGPASGPPPGRGQPQPGPYGSAPPGRGGPGGPMGGPGGPGGPMGGPGGPPGGPYNSSPYNTAPYGSSPYGSAPPGRGAPGGPGPYGSNVPAGYGSANPYASQPQNDVVKSGYATKNSGSSPKKWEKRFFVLTRKGELHYYNKPNEKSPLKTVNIDRCGAREATKEVGKEQKMCAEIFRVDGDAVMKPHYTFLFFL